MGTKSAYDIAQNYRYFPDSCRKNFEDVYEIPKRVPSLDLLKGTFEVSSKKTNLSPNWEGIKASAIMDLLEAGCPANSSDVEYVSYIRDIRRIIEHESSTPFNVQWYNSLCNIFADKINYSAWVSPTQSVKLSRICAHVDLGTKHLLNNKGIYVKGNGIFSNFYERLVGGYSETTKLYVEQANTLKDFLLTAASCAGVSSCHNPIHNDSEYKFGQWAHLLNPSIAHFFLTTTNPNGKQSPKDRVARCNIFAVWDERSGKHMWIISREYASPGFKNILGDWLFEKAKELGISVVYYGTDTRGDRVATVACNLVGAEFEPLVKNLPRFYPDRHDTLKNIGSKYKTVMLRMGTKEYFTEGTNRTYDLSDKDIINVITKNIVVEAKVVYTVEPDYDDEDDEDDQDGMLECGICGRGVYEDETLEYRGELYCHNCVVECEHCAHVFVNTDIITTHNGHSFCKACFDVSTSTCIKCLKKEPIYKQDICYTCHFTVNGYCSVCGKEKTRSVMVSNILCLDCAQKPKLSPYYELNHPNRSKTAENVEVLEKIVINE